MILVEHCLPSEELSDVVFVRSFYFCFCGFFVVVSVVLLFFVFVIVVDVFVNSLLRL